MLGGDEVLRGGKLQDNIGLMGLIRLIRRIGLIHLFNKAN